MLAERYESSTPLYQEIVSNWLSGQCHENPHSDASLLIFALTNTTMDEDEALAVLELLVQGFRAIPNDAIRWEATVVIGDVLRKRQLLLPRDVLVELMRAVNVDTYNFVSVGFERIIDVYASQGELSLVQTMISDELTNTLAVFHRAGGKARANELRDRLRTLEKALAPKIAKMRHDTKEKMRRVKKKLSALHGRHDSDREKESLRDDLHKLEGDLERDFPLHFPAERREMRPVADQLKLLMEQKRQIGRLSLLKHALQGQSMPRRR